MRTLKITSASEAHGFKVQYTKTSLRRYGTDVTHAATGRVLKLAGRLTQERAVEYALKYFRDEAILAGAVRDVPEELISVQRYLFRARDCEPAGDTWRAYNSAGLITERLVRAIQDGLL